MAPFVVHKEEEREDRNDEAANDEDNDYHAAIHAPLHHYIHHFNMKTRSGNWNLCWFIIFDNIPETGQRFSLIIYQFLEAFKFFVLLVLL